MTTATHTKPLTPDEQRAVVSRLVGTPGFAALIAESRKQDAQRRAEMLAELAAGTAEEDARILATARAFEKADTAARAASQAAREAAQAASEAQSTHLGARSAADKRRGRIQAVLRATADPRIGELRLHLESLDEAVRHCARPVVERAVPDGLTGRQRLVDDWNTSSVEAARAILRELQGELAALQVSDYGADCRPLLVSVLARAEAACAPLGAFAEGPGGRRLARHEIGA